ncbi:MAG: Gluconokinase / oxidoreductase domain [uncultured Acetobacteraceae bacterium]|uniref:Gluconokinase / oxidoreductase domain n=1 Tax=uncultured Acetobacteraceae bacterium TaxID=169975 RepID=A0A6J4J060_9PROT|nr:MAG: Gluconokinase / oxidoreductase domain [uncultured Acetobacteraceae bacterium]
MPIGVGLIGLGMATAPHMMSLRELEESGRVRIIGGHAPSATRRDDFTARWDAPVFAEQAALLAAPGLDLVLVLTPPGAHLPVAHAAIAAGKHILVEKPIELTVARGEALAAAAEAAGVRCGVCLQHRFRPAALRLKATLASGALGKPLSASASIRWWRDDVYFAQPGRGTMARDGGGVLLTQAIHTLDLLLHLMGPVRDAAGFAITSPLRKIDTEDVAAAALRFENGAIGVLDATSVARPGFPERIEIAGTSGSAVLAAHRLELHGMGGAPPEVVGQEGSGGGGADPMAFDHGPHRALITEMLDAVEQGREPSNSARSALPVQRLIEAVLADSARRA